MMRAAQLGFNVSKPGGDSSRYDVSVEDEGRAIYVLAKKTWFILPSRVVLLLKSNIRVAPGMKKQKYARYEEAWHQLRKSGRKG